MTARALQASWGQAPSDDGGAPSGGKPISIRVQTVFYRPEPGSVDRFLDGLEQATTIAMKELPGVSISLAMGDSSPTATFSLDEVEKLGHVLGEVGVRTCVYDFFGGNLGSAAGHNRLLDSLDEDYVLFLNPDAYASPFLIPELLLPLADSTIGIVEARQLPLEHPKAFDADSGDTSWASTAGALVRRSVVEDVNGFDSTSFFLYCDDVDFSWRARLAGYRVVHQPAARIFHDKRLAIDGNMVIGEAERYYAAEAALMLAWKYSRSDLADEWAEGLAVSPDPLQQKAAHKFLDLRERDMLPLQLDGGDVAQFIGHDFAHHRFSYADA